MGCPSKAALLTLYIMYDFKERQALTRKIASPENISIYRELLSAYGSRQARTLMSDKVQLARMLVYELLGYCRADEIIASCKMPDTAASRKSHHQTLESGKKKSANLMNILESRGKSLMTRLSGLRTASIRIGSIAGADSKK